MGLRLDLLLLSPHPQAISLIYLVIINPTRIYDFIVV